MQNLRQEYTDFISVYFELKDTTDENQQKFNSLKNEYEIEIPKLEQNFQELERFLKSINVNKFEQMEESSKRMLCDKLLKYNKEQKLVEKKLESIEEELRVQANDNKLAENMEDGLNTSSEKLDMLEQRMGVSREEDDDEDYSESHSIAEEDVLNKINTLYTELNDLAMNFVEQGSNDGGEIDNAIFDFDEDEDELEEAKLMENLKKSVEDNKNKSFYLEGQVIKLREEYTMKLDELKRLREISVKQDINDEQQKEMNTTLSQKNSTSNIYSKKDEKDNSKNNSSGDLYNSRIEKSGLYANNELYGNNVSSRVNKVLNETKNNINKRKSAQLLGNSRASNSESLDNKETGQEVEIPQILKPSLDAYPNGAMSQSRKSLGIKWNKDISQRLLVRKKKDDDELGCGSDSNSVDIVDSRGLTRRTMSQVHFLQEQYLTSLERLKVEDMIRDSEKKDMNEMVQALLGVMNRRLETMEDNDKENYNNNTNTKSNRKNEKQKEKEGLAEIREFIENVKRTKKNAKLEEENDKLLRRLAQLKKKVDEKLNTAQSKTEMNAGDKPVLEEVNN